MARPGRLMPQEMFEADSRSTRSLCLARRHVPAPPHDVAVRGSLDATKAALDQLPVLKASGGYGIVRRLAGEPGSWEPVPA
ncbi:hypothetical protein ACOM2C_07795 [Pseudarthrobacter sp. So.54]